MGLLKLNKWDIPMALILIIDYIFSLHKTRVIFRVATTVTVATGTSHYQLGFSNFDIDALMKKIIQTLNIKVFK